MTTTLRNDIADYMASQLADLTPSWASEYPEALDDLKTGLQLEGALYCMHSYRAVAKSVNTTVERVLDLINFVNVCRKTQGIVTEAQGRAIWNLNLTLRGLLGGIPKDFLMELADDLSTGYSTPDEIPSLINDFKLTQLDNGKFDSEINFLQTLLKSLGEQLQYDKLNDELNHRFLTIQNKLKSLIVERQRLVDYQVAFL